MLLCTQIFNRSIFNLGEKKSLIFTFIDISKRMSSQVSFLVHQGPVLEIYSRISIVQDSIQIEMNSKWVKRQLGWKVVHLTQFKTHFKVLH